MRNKNEWYKLNKIQNEENHLDIVFTKWPCENTSLLNSTFPLLSEEVLSSFMNDLRTLAGQAARFHSIVDHDGKMKIMPR